MGLGTRTARYDVYFWGILCQDIILRLSDLPRGDSGGAILEEQLAVGGDAANSAYAANHLGLNTALQANHLGRDERARYLLRELRKRGQRLYGLRRNTKPTVHAYCLALPDGHRSIFGAFAQKKISLPEVNLLKASRSFCLDGYYGQASGKACAMAKRAGLTIFANDICPSETYFPLVDYIILSHRAGDISGARRFLKLAKRKTKGTVIITMGKDGTLAIDDTGKIVRQRGFLVKVVDSTGAGDAFRASFIYGILKGWAMERCLRFAGGFAALSCKGIGGSGYLPSAAETEKFIR